MVVVKNKDLCLATFISIHHLKVLKITEIEFEMTLSLVPNQAPGRVMFVQFTRLT